MEISNEYPTIEISNEWATPSRPFCDLFFLLAWSPQRVTWRKVYCLPHSPLESRGQLRPGCGSGPQEGKGRNHFLKGGFCGEKSGLEGDMWWWILQQTSYLIIAVSGPPASGYARERGKAQVTCAQPNPSPSLPRRSDRWERILSEPTHQRFVRLFCGVH